MLGMFWDSIRSNPGPLIGVLFTTATLVFVLLFANRTDRPEVMRQYLIEEDDATEQARGTGAASVQGVASDVTDSGPNGS